MSPLEIASVPTTSSVATEVLKRFLGPIAVSMTAVALMVSSFGSLHSSVLANSRVPYAMARDGLFFRALAHLSPRSNVPARAIVAQAAWGSVLALSGSYDALTDSVIFASWLFYGLSTGSLFIFRRTMPDAPRPYRALGYPVVPVIFLLVTAALLINTFVAAPNEALKGVAVLLRGCRSIGTGRGRIRSRRVLDRLLALRIRRLRPAGRIPALPPPCRAQDAVRCRG